MTMKRSLAALLSLMLIISCMSISAFAATSGKIAVDADAKNVSPGDTVEFTVYLSNCVEVINYEYEVVIPDGLTFVKKSAKIDADFANDTGISGPSFSENTLTGSATGAALSTGGYTGAGKAVIMTFQCTVDADATGDLTVKLDNALLTDTSFKTVKASKGSATVTVVVEVEHECKTTHVEEVPATCTEPGVKAHDVCEECGKLYINGKEVSEEDLVIKAKGHKWVWVIDKEATEDTTGRKHQECSECHATQKEGTVIPRLKGDGDDTTTPVAPAAKIPFTDVFESDWFYNDIVYVYEHGLMNGMSATEFGPYGITTRGQIVTILWRLEGEPAVAGACPFADVKAGSYYEKAITWAATNGIVTGYDATTFGPNDQITREQMAAILFRYAQYKGLASVSEVNNLVIFTDADKISAYAVDAMNWAVGQGLINGMGDGTVAPQGNAIRAQAAAILHRFCETLEML